MAHRGCAELESCDRLAANLRYCGRKGVKHAHEHRRASDGHQAGFGVRFAWCEVVTMEVIGEVIACTASWCWDAKPRASPGGISRPA